MEFHILVNGKRIASFAEKTDRDICFDALGYYWGFEEADPLFTKEEGV